MAERTLAVVHARSSIDWQREFAPRLVRGLKAIGWNVETVHDNAPRDDGLPILLGTSSWKNLEHGDFLLVDRCSFGDTDHWVSLVRNGHGRRGDHRVPAGAPASRWERHAQPVEAWHNGPRTVLCGQHDAWSPHYATPDAWYEDVRSAATHFRRHPQADNPTGLPDTRGWNGVGQAITLNSSVAIAAVLAGVPTVTMDEGAMAWDVTGHAPGEIIKPPRLPWLHWLAWTQWSHDEVEEGKPWAHLIS